MLPSRSRSWPPPILLPFLPRRSFAISLSLSDDSRSQPQHTVAEEPVCARECTVQRQRRPRQHRCTFARIHVHAVAHWAQTAITVGVQRSLDSSLSRSPVPPTTPSPSRSLPLLRHSLALARSPHTTFYLSLTSRVFFVSRSPSSPPPAFLFLQRWIYLPVFRSSPAPSPPPFSPPNTSLLHTVHPPSFLSVHRFPWLSLLLIFFSSPIPSLPVPRPFLLASFLPTRLFPSRRPPPPPSPHGTLVNRHGSLCSSLLSFLPFFFHHLSRERNALGAVERERESAMSERRELGGGKERPLFSRPQRGMGYRGPIMDLSVGCCWCCCNCLRSSEPSCCS